MILKLLTEKVTSGIPIIIPAYANMPMHFTSLANELVLHIFQSCTSIADLLSLASTCRHFHSILHSSSHRLPTLYLAAHAQYGPLTDAIRLVTHNSSQPAHLPRPAPPQSLTLLRQLMEVGRIANAWADLYPSQKWRGADSASRRLLTESERYRLRRACYRLWLYSLAFHTPFYPRTTRLSPPVVRIRAQLLRPWFTDELAELLDLQTIFRQILQSTICPSNGTVIRKHKQRYPDDPFPLISVTHPGKYASQHAGFHRQIGAFHSTLHSSHLLPFAPTEKYQRTQQEIHGTTLEGWGDEITHYYVLEDMLKLNPSQLLYLYSSIVNTSAGPGFNAGQSLKGLVEAFVAGLGEGGGWFENNGETLAETVGFVVGERGGDVGDVRAMVEDGMEGVVRGEGRGENSQ
ncbi:MAG: hypothetical protein Q9163_002030 [Psora crenata]